MAIKYLDERGNLHIVGGHDPKLKLAAVGAEPVSKGFRTKGPDAQTNRNAALEASNAALEARMAKLKAECEATRRKLAETEAELAAALAANKANRLVSTVNAAPVNKPSVSTDVNAPVNNQPANNVNAVNRADYMREYMRKKREAKRQAKAEVPHDLPARD